MPNNLGISSVVAEMRAEFRRMPEELRAEGEAIVIARGEQAMDSIVAQYPEHTGNLKSHVKREIERSTFGVRVTVRSTARHGFIFEEGTKVRHTKSGASRGFMPAADIFVPVSIRKRDEMHADLMALVASKGLEVTGQP